MEWITDRQPTTEDEDRDGEVLIKRFPDGRKSRRLMQGSLVAAAHVGPGVPWMHTAYWQPPATPEPEPEASKPTPKPELRVGQVWRTGDGKEVTIRVEDNNPHTSYPFLGSNDEWYTSNGRWSADGEDDENDLVELITDTPDPVQPEPWPLPRVFAAPIRRTFLPSGGQVLDAIADDGTCWQMFPSDTGWQQVQPLPPATEEQG